MRQHCCAASGGVLLLVLAVAALSEWQFASGSVAVVILETFLARTLLATALVAVTLGACGLIAICCGNRLLLCGYSVLTLILGFACISTLVALLIEVANQTTCIDFTCARAQTSDVPSDLDTDAYSIAGMPACITAVEAHRAYEAMQNALHMCRQVQPNALSLDACPWQSAVYNTSNLSAADALRWEKLFRWAEDEYSCGGFCRSHLALFALPEGSVNEGNKLQSRSACYAPLVEEVRKRSRPAFLLLFATAIISLLPAACGFWLACAFPPKRRANHVHRPEELAWTPLPQDDDEEDDEEYGVSSRYPLSPQE